jgi:hypothetical protein
MAHTPTSRNADIGINDCIPRTRSGSDVNASSVDAPSERWAVGTSKGEHWHV